MADGIEFDWDRGNIEHLASHGVTRDEFEAVLSGEPLDLDYESVDEEDRFRAVGMTQNGRLLTIVYTVRAGKIRAITAFPAGVADRKAFVGRIL